MTLWYWSRSWYDATKDELIIFLLRNAEDHAENCLPLLQLVSSSGDNCEGDDGDDDGDDGDDDGGDDNDADISGDTDDDDDDGGT